MKPSSPYLLCRVFSDFAFKNNVLQEVINWLFQHSAERSQSTSDKGYFCVLLIKKASPLVNDAF